MANPGVQQTETGDLAQRRALVKRVLESQAFATTPRLREFLAFVAEQSFAGKDEDLSELAIAIDVFHRKVDFNPGTDNIVRSTARLLRQRLSAHFENEGRGETLTCEIPKGGYRLVFSQREAPAIPGAPERAGAGLTPAAVDPRPRFWGIFLAGALCGAAAVLLISNSSRIIPSFLPETTLIGHATRDSSLPTRIVVSDFSAVIMREWAGRPLSLHDYSERAYLQEKWIGPRLSEELMPLHGLVGKSQLTTLGDLHLAHRILEWLEERGRTGVVRHAREMTARELKDSNLIFLGGIGSIPWVSVLEGRLSFEQMPPLAAASGFTARQTPPGKPSEYRNGILPDGSHRLYARIAGLDNPSGKGSILLLSGTSMSSTEAAADFAFSSSGLRAILDSASARNLSGLRTYEALLEMEEAEGAMRSIKIVDFRSR